MKQFLMCSPEQIYDCNYVINPWMVGNMKNIDADKALFQWKKFKEELSKVARIKAMYEFVDRKVNIPDLVFTANAALLFRQKDGKKSAIISNFFYDERKTEQPFHEKWFTEMDYALFHTKSAFEGAGDALEDFYGRLWIGTGKRSESNAVDEICDITNSYFTNYLPMQLVDGRFYHLDTCFCPLRTDQMLVYKGAFSEGSLEFFDMLEITEENNRLITVEEEDAVNFACNAVNIDNIIFTGKISNHLRNKLEKYGYEVVELDLSEFIKTGGSAKCLTLELMD